MSITSIPLGISPVPSRSLGKGLSALIGNEVPNAVASRSPQDGGVVSLPLVDIEPGIFQPRRFFDEEQLRELATSIRQSGVIQPIIVRRTNADKYQIIAGERRWRASKLASMITIPAIVRPLNDQETLECGLLENIQRQDLTPIEEADACHRLVQQFAYTQEKLSTILGKSRSHITNLLRLLSLPDEVKDMVNSGTLSMGHARAILNASDPVAFAKKVVAQQWSVRQTEQRAKQTISVAEEPKPIANAAASPQRRTVAKDPDTLALETLLSQATNLDITIEHEETGGGKVIISFRSLQQLDKVMLLLGADA